MHRLCVSGTSPRPLGRYEPADHRELASALAHALGPGERDVLGPLVHGRPALFDGEVLDVWSLTAAGIEAVPCEPEPPVERSADAGRAVALALEALAAGLARKAPDAPPLWEGPAWCEDVAMLEATLGAPLPDALLSLLARHDGARFGLGRYRVLSAPDMETAWATQQRLAGPLAEADALAEPDPGVGPRWWCAGWVPFASDVAGNLLCVDSAPVGGGTVGQVVEFLLEEGRRRRLAPGLAEWLEEKSAALERGTLVALEQPDGTFDGLLEREEVRGARRGLVHVRGETPEERRQRIARDVLAEPAVLTGVVLDVLRENQQLRLRTGTVEPLVLWPLAQRVLACSDSLEVRLHRLLWALDACPAVEHLDVSAEELIHEVKAALR
jgi:cell wall assembly regulator SMI1